MNRSELRARSASAPIASSTWLGRATPALQADPVEHSMPRASSSISSASPSAPGKDRCALPGSRPGPPSTRSSSGAPLSCASGTSATTPATSRSRSPASRAARSSRGRRRPRSRPRGRRSRRRRASRTARRAPGRRRAAAACTRRRGPAAARRRPSGPPSLCPVMVSASTPLAREVHRHLADRLHRVGVQRDADGVRDRGQRRDVADRADLVVGPHHAGDARRRVPSPERLGERLRHDPAGRLDGQPGDLRAVVLGQPLDAVQDGVVLGGAHHDPAAAGVGLPARPEQALDREVVALGAAAGEEHLRRAGRPAPRRTARGTARPRGGRRGRSRAARRRSPPGPAARSSQPAPRAAPAWSPRGPEYGHGARRVDAAILARPAARPER